MEGLATSSTAMVNRFLCSTDRPLSPARPTMAPAKDLSSTKSITCREGRAEGYRAEEDRTEEAEEEGVKKKKRKDEKAYGCRYGPQLHQVHHLCVCVGGGGGGGGGRAEEEDTAENKDKEGQDSLLQEPLMGYAERKENATCC